jgi:hypothetical protein
VAARRSRNARRAGLALALLAGALVIGWKLRGDTESRALEASRELAQRKPEADAAQLVEREPERELEQTEPAAAEAHAQARASSTEIPSPIAPDDALVFEHAQVHVLVLGLDADEERAFVEALVFDARGETRAYGVHETDVRGRLVLRLPPGTLRVSAWTHAQVAASVRAELTPLGASLQLQLAPAETITGQVTDARTGAVIEGARITLPRSRELAEARSDEHGRYAIAIEPDGQHALRCSAEGYAFERADVSAIPGKRWDRQPGQENVRVLAAGQPFEIDFALLPERTIRGRVYGHALPLAGATIEALGHVSTGMQSAAPDNASAVSDDEGDFELRALRPDLGHLLTLRHADFATTQLYVPPALEPRQELGRVQLGAAGRIDVLVVDSAGTRIDGLQVELETALARHGGGEATSAEDFPRDVGLGGSAVVLHDRTNAIQSWHPEIAALEQNRRRIQRTDADGIASFADLVAGTHALKVQGHWVDALRGPVELSAGELRRVEVVLPAVPPVTGRVLDADGPVEGAMVFLGHRHTLSDAQGRFSFAGLHEGASYELRAASPGGHAPHQPKPVQVKPGASIELRFPNP